jgi:hypothetical protein
MNFAPGKSELQYKQIINGWFDRCDNHYVIPAETPESKGKLVIEFE